MIDQLLDPIYATQKRLNERAHHSLKEYIDQAHCSVQEMVESDGLSVHYGNRIGGHETAGFMRRKDTHQTPEAAILIRLASDWWQFPTSGLHD